MPDVHNTYHFVPTSPVAPGDSSRSAKLAFVSGKAIGSRHDIYQDTTHSGRVICTLEAVTPLVLGSSQTTREAEPTLVLSCARDGKPFLPASSLRGMVGSVLEAASNSALRVLRDQEYSYRMDMPIRHESLSAIGMIVCNGSECRLRPVSLPTLTTRAGTDFRLDRRFQQLFPKPSVRVYFGSKESIRDPKFTFRTYAKKPGSNVFHYLLLRPAFYKSPGVVDHAGIAWYKKTGERSEFLLGQYAFSNPRTMVGMSPHQTVPLTQEQFDQLSLTQQGGYTRGILRILGCRDRKDEMPVTKKHELFLPYDVDMETWPTVLIPPQVVKQFEDLADERTDSRKTGPALPFEPTGTDRNQDSARLKNYFRLKDGDLVFFEPNDDGTEIKEISLSSIWRRRVENNGKAVGTHAFFGRIDKELLPFVETARATVSVAERMLGFVEIDPKRDEEKRGGRAFASRLRFADGELVTHPDHSPWNDALTLRILASPKPPSTSLYFKGGYQQPNALGQGNAEPQGRKFYLHHRPEHLKPGSLDVEPASDTARLPQKFSVTPAAPGCVFSFHIDFDNLTDDELGLLLYSLKPDTNFHHKLGLAKPLGLGTVKIRTAAVLCVDRSKRYQSAEGFGNKRYHRGWYDDQLLTTPLLIRYPSEERDILDNLQAFDQQGLRTKTETRLTTQYPQIQQALRVLGDRDSVQHPVSTPLADGQKFPCENKSFRWFVANDKSQVWGAARIPPQKQVLAPISDGGSVPVLRGNPWLNIPPDAL